MSSPQHHAGRATRLQCFAPAGRAQAPAVAGPEAGKAELGQGRRKIIAARIGKLEKLGSNNDTHRVASDVFSIGVAATVAKEPRLGLHRADVEPVAEDIPRRAWVTSTVPAFVPQHCSLRIRGSSIRRCPRFLASCRAVALHGHIHAGGEVANAHKEADPRINRASANNSRGKRRNCRPRRSGHFGCAFNHWT